MDSSIRNRYTPKIQSVTLSSATKSKRSSSAERSSLRSSSTTRFYQERSLSSKRMTSSSSSGSSKAFEDEFKVLQLAVKFIEHSEYNFLAPGENMVIVSYYWPLETQEALKNKYSAHIEDLVSTIRRKFPFVQVLSKSLLETAATNFGKDQPSNIQIEVQMATLEKLNSLNTTIIASMGHSKILPSVSVAVSRIQSQLKNVEVIVKVDCEGSEAHVIGRKFQINQLSLLEGLEVSIKQIPDDIPLPLQAYGKNKLNTSLVSQTKSLVQKQDQSQELNQNSSFMSRMNDSRVGNSASRQNTENRKFMSSSTFTDNKKSFMFATSTSQSSVTSASSVSSSKLRSSHSIGVPVKLFTSKSLTNWEGYATLSQIPFDLTINLRDLEQQQRTSPYTIQVNLERDDLTNCQINVKSSKGPRPNVRIGNYEFWQKDAIHPTQSTNQLWSEEIGPLSDNQTFKFNCEPGSYFLEAMQDGCFPERRSIHLKKGNFNLTVILTKATVMSIKLRTRNLITQSEEGAVSLLVRELDGREIFRGVTGEKTGEVNIEVSLLKTIVITSSKPNFVEITQEVLLSASTLEYDILVFPQNENVRNRLDILVFEPHEAFNIRFQLSAESNSKDAPNFILSQQQPRNPSMAATFDSIELPNNSKLTALSIGLPKGRNFDFTAFSELSKPNVKENNAHKTMVLGDSQSRNNQFDDSDHENRNFIDLYSKTTILSSPSRQQKYEQHQKVGRNFCKAVQSVNGYFFAQRLGTKPLTFQKNLTEFNYLNERIHKYQQERSAKIFVVYDNKLVSLTEINQNILPEPKVLGTFQSSIGTYVQKQEIKFSSNKTQTTQIIPLSASKMMVN